MTPVGPTSRMTCATWSFSARSSHTSETTVISSPRVRNCTDRRGTSIASHHRTRGGAPALPEPRVHAHVHPVLPELPALRCALTHPGREVDHAVAVQDGLE